MISVISSAKTMDFSNVNSSITASDVTKYYETDQIINEIKTLDIIEIKRTMKVSDKIALLNYERYKNHDELTTKQALFAYDGDVYTNMKREELTNDMLSFTQDHIRIISGLYGILRPLDKIRAYRLEMSIRLNNLAPKGLNEFWKRIVTDRINNDLKSHKNKFLVNLASKEYINTIDIKLLLYPMINIHFLEMNNGSLKNIPINSKRARGMMVGYITKNKIDNLKEIKSFSKFGYSFDNLNSTYNDYYFVKNNN